MENQETRQRDQPGGGRIRRWVRRFARMWLADLLLVGGAAAVTAAAAMVDPVLGWLFGGCIAMVFGVLVARGDDGGGGD